MKLLRDAESPPSPAAQSEEDQSSVGTPSYAGMTTRRSSLADPTSPEPLLFSSSPGARPRRPTDAIDAWPACRTSNDAMSPRQRTLQLHDAIDGSRDRHCAGPLLPAHRVPSRSGAKGIQGQAPVSPLPTLTYALDVIFLPVAPARAQGFRLEMRARRRRLFPYPDPGRGNCNQDCRAPETRDHCARAARAMMRGLHRRAVWHLFTARAFSYSARPPAFCDLKRGACSLLQCPGPGAMEMEAGRTRLKRVVISCRPPLLLAVLPAGGSEKAGLDILLDLGKQRRKLEEF